MKKILVAVDFSPASQRALDTALALARATGARLHLLHSLHVPSDVRLTGEWWATLRAAAVKGLDACQDRADAVGVPVETEISDIYAVDAIVDAARRTGADLIALGTRGHGLLAHALLGSVAQRVLRAAPCPVLTVPLGA